MDRTAAELGLESLVHSPGTLEQCLQPRANLTDKTLQGERAAKRVHKCT